MRLILTSCGLSLITNYYKTLGKNPGEVYKYSNLKKNEFEKEVLDSFEKNLNELKEKIKNFSNNKLKIISAELNALLNFYKESLEKNDYHLLFYTDTYLGSKTAEILEEFLIFKDCNVIKYKANDLNTASLEEFQIALSDVIKDLSEILTGYKGSYEIIFNLTGGFKSVNSFLQTMATLWADKSIYIFEGSNELLVIPRLPLKIDEDIFIKNFRVFRSLELGFDVSMPEEIPLSIINKIGNEFMVSPWGEILWQKIKNEVYKKQLVNPITDKIIYSQNFKKQFENFSPQEKYQINKTIDKLERFVSFKENLKSLRVHELSGEISKKYNLECYPFDGNDSRRLYCNKKGDKIILEVIGTHLK